MIIDVHTHVFPESIRKDRTSFFDSEPAFKTLYADEKARCVGYEELIQGMDENRVDLSVTFGFPWRSRELCRRHNDYILEAVEAYPDRLKGFCCVPADRAWAAEEVRRCLEGGLSGIGELAFYGRDFSEDLVASCGEVMAAARERDVPVMLHTNEPVGADYPGKAPMTLPGIYRFVKAYPENRLILAHWGGGLIFYGLMKREVPGSLKNVWFDTAASPYLYRQEIYSLAVSAAGADKILFGSDYPLIPPRRYFSEMTAASIGGKERARICGENAAALLGISARGR
ncbi:MAG TPA: amidohydrolase [Desulfobacteraceae bacterium]|nr:amidohydrolase [Desulfobacteraceae bacterium]